nr:unnamed protein product [Callosobruchus chinensis]
MSEITFRTKAVRKVLQSLDINKATGPDMIPAVVAKKCAPEVAPILTRLFRMSYSSGVFPKDWKSACIQPVPKKGYKAVPSNYRPIALLSTQYCTLSNKRCSSEHSVLMNNQALLRSHSFKLLGVSITENMIWHEHVSAIATAAGKKLGYLFRARKYFSPSNILTLYKAQIRPSLEYCSHIW